MKVLLALLLGAALVWPVVATAGDHWARDPVGGKWRCTPKTVRREVPPKNTICATRDWKHWRLVYVNPFGADVESIDAMYRWSEKDAILLVSGDNEDTGGATVPHWTRDGGRHWWTTYALYLGYSPQCLNLLEALTTPFTCEAPKRLARRDDQLLFSYEVLTSTPQPPEYPLLQRTDGIARLDGWPRKTSMPPCTNTITIAGPPVCVAHVEDGFHGVPLGG